MRVFPYGERLRFAAKLRAPRNFRNPGAFDYRGYLADRGIVMLASTKDTKVEVLPGFVGTRVRWWRERVHRSIVRKIHAVWSAEDAALMDAAVVGESAFLTPATKVDFRDQNLSHPGCVRMNVSISVCCVLDNAEIAARDFVASGLTVALCTAYAFVTDVGPSCGSAVLMLTVYWACGCCIANADAECAGGGGIGGDGDRSKSGFGPASSLRFLPYHRCRIAVPVLERTSQPFGSLRHLDSTDYDRTLSPRVAQMRLDLRLVAGRLAVLLGPRAARFGMGATARCALSAYEVLCVSVLMQLGLALPMVYYFHRATVIGMAANSFAVPLTGILMPAAVLAVALSYVWLPLAKLPAISAAWALHGVTGTVRSLG
jgi:competence protein ComEC